MHDCHAMWLSCIWIWRGEWQLPPLNGIASAPMLREDGTIGSAQGYDITTGMWLENVPDMASLVPERPTDEDARSALHYIRETFKTFCFADAETMLDPNSEVAVVNTAKPPGKDESAFLTALLTAVCRPSLYLAPACYCAERRYPVPGRARVCLPAASASLPLVANLMPSPAAVHPMNWKSGSRRS